jgi:hypothetical protein
VIGRILPVTGPFCSAATAIIRRSIYRSVELPDGVTFEQYVLRIPKAAMMAARR